MTASDVKPSSQMKIVADKGWRRLAQALLHGRSTDLRKGPHSTPTRRAGVNSYLTQPHPLLPSPLSEDLLTLARLWGLRSTIWRRRGGAGGSTDAPDAGGDDALSEPTSTPICAGATGSIDLQCAPQAGAAGALPAKFVGVDAVIAGAEFAEAAAALVAAAIGAKVSAEELGSRSITLGAAAAGSEAGLDDGATTSGATTGADSSAAARGDAAVEHAALVRRRPFRVCPARLCDSA